MSLQLRIESRLTEALSPSHLDVENESNQHNVPPGSETHFRVTVVSERFEGQSPVQRHRAIYGLLEEEMAEGVHALAIGSYTPSEWDQRTSDPQSPDCQGGKSRE